MLIYIWPWHWHGNNASCGFERLSAQCVWNTRESRVHLTMNIWLFERPLDAISHIHYTQHMDAHMLTEYILNIRCSMDAHASRSAISMRGAVFPVFQLDMWCARSLLDAMIRRHTHTHTYTRIIPSQNYYSKKTTISPYLLPVSTYATIIITQAVFLSPSDGKHSCVVVHPPHHTQRQQFSMTIWWNIIVSRRKVSVFYQQHQKNHPLFLKKENRARRVFTQKAEFIVVMRGDCFVWWPVRVVVYVCFFCHTGFYIYSMYILSMLF